MQRALKPVDGGRYQSPKDATTSYWLVAGSPEYGIAVLEGDAGSIFYFGTQADAFVDKDAFDRWLDAKRAELKGHLTPAKPATTSQGGRGARGGGRRNRGTTMSLADLGKSLQQEDTVGAVDSMGVTDVLFRLRKHDKALNEAEGRREMREQHARGQKLLKDKQERDARRNADIVAQAQAVVTWALQDELPAKSWKSWESYPHPVPHPVATKVGELWKQQAPSVLPDHREVWPRFRMPQYKFGTGLVTGNLELFLIKNETGVGKVKTEQQVCDLHLPIDMNATIEV